MIEISVGSRVADTKLTVVEELPRVQSGRKYRRVFRCVCDCGNERVIRLDHLRSGHSTSCGCYVDPESFKKRPGYHGMYGSPEHGVWKGIKKRCYDPHAQRYGRYGGRGITMCERWKSSFKAFYEDVGPRPSPKHSIDRYPNRDGNYEPGNVRWATAGEQRRNTDDVRILEFRGERMCLADWAKRLGMRKGTLYYRLQRGLSVEEALTTPVRPWGSQ